MTGTATFSPCGRYRYRLARTFSAGLSERLGPLTFVGLNPSTADADMNDPTVRRVCGYARRWRYPRVEVVNLFAFRATNPDDLFEVIEEEGLRAAIGPENDAAILTACRGAYVLAGWGVHGCTGSRSREVLEVLRRAGDVHALRLTKGGEPSHPLYLPADLEPFILA